MRNYLGLLFALVVGFCASITFYFTIQLATPGKEFVTAVLVSAYGMLSMISFFLFADWNAKRKAKIWQAKIDNDRAWKKLGDRFRGRGQKE